MHQSETNAKYVMDDLWRSSFIWWGNRNLIKSGTNVGLSSNIFTDEQCRNVYNKNLKNSSIYVADLNTKTMLTSFLSENTTAVLWKGVKVVFDDHQHPTFAAHRPERPPAPNHHFSPKEGV
jgi:hypothetical protein